MAVAYAIAFLECETLRLTEFGRFDFAHRGA